MTSKRVYYGIIGLVVLLCLALVVGAKVSIGKLATKSNNLVSLQLKLDSLNQEQSQLSDAKTEIKKYQPLADIAASIVPQDKNQAETVREIVSIANTNGINLSSVTFPKSSLGTPGKATSASLNLSQLTPVPGLAGVYQLPITVSVDPSQPVGYNQFLNFLSSLEHDRRTAQVTDILLTPDAKDPSLLSFTLSINEYIKP